MSKSQLDYLLEDAQGGFENLTADTTSVPFIHVLQDLSPAVKRNKPESVEGAEAGMFMNSVTKRLFKSPLRVVVGRFDRYYCEWKPNRGGFVRQWTVDEVSSSLAKGLIGYNEKRQIVTREGNSVQETYVYYSILPDFPEEGVVIFSLASSQIREAKKWNRLMLSTNLPGTNKRAAPYFVVWELSTVEQSNDKGDWYGLNVKFDSIVDKETYALVMDARTTLPDKTADMRQLEQNTAAALPSAPIYEAPIDASDVPF